MLIEQAPQHLLSNVMTKSRVVRRGLCAVVGSAALLLVSASASALTFYVDGAHPGATDSGPGTAGTPYKTIKAAVSARAVAGNTIIVKPAVYREIVKFSATGTPANPVFVRAEPGVIVAGSDDFSATTKWTLYTGNVYVATSVTWTPGQVFADGARLTPSTLAPAALPNRSFRYVSGSGLYVNVGGGNPASRACEVGRRGNGFDISGAHVTLDGFAVTRTEDVGIQASGQNLTVQNCTVTFANRYGIRLDAATGSLIARNVVGDSNDHGIYVTGGTTSSVVRGNESYRSARPAQRAANGINIYASPGCIVEANNCHDNQDSGIQFYSGSNDCICRNNVSWNNGDHGYDHVRSTGVAHFHNIAFGNYKDGFSFEGDSPGGRLYNSIGVDNGITAAEYNLWVDPASAVGFESNHNIFWNSTSQKPVKYSSSAYSSVSSYSSATGRDGSSKQLNPLFVNAAAGNFRLTTGSPAIDNAITSIPGWPWADALGASRFDVASIANAGSGPVTFADRGAYEFASPGAAADRAPAVSAPASMGAAEGTPLFVTVTANDPDGQAIASLTADLSGLPAGHGAVFTKNAANTVGSLTWTPAYTHSRATPYTVRFTATNSLAATATTALTVANIDRAPVVSAPPSASGGESGVISVAVTASDPDADAIGVLSANLSALPAGHDARFVVNGANTAGTFTWTPTFADAGGPYPIVFICGNALTGRDTTLVTVVNVDRAPHVSVPALVVTSETQQLTLAVAAADPDGNAIASLVADLSALPAGHDAVFTPHASNTSGTLTWTPAAIHAPGPYVIGFTTTNAMSATATTSLRIDRLPVVNVTPSAAAAEGNPLSLDVTVHDPDSDAIFTLAADFSQLPEGHGAAFTPNGGHTGGTLTWTPGFEDAPGAFTVNFIATSGGATAAPVGGGVVEWSGSGAASTVLAVDNVDRAPSVVAASTAAAPEGGTLTFVMSAFDPDGDAITSLTADLSAFPLSSDAAFEANLSNTGGTLSWTPQQLDGLTDPYAVTFTASNALSGTATTQVSIDRAPTVSAPRVAATLERQQVGVVVTVSDPDDDTITSLTADLSALPAGNDATFAPGAGNTSGTLMWTPSFEDSGSYAVTFTAHNGQSASTQTSVIVANVDRAPAIAAPATRRTPEGATFALHIEASDPDGDPILLLTADLAALPALNDAAFVPDDGNTGGTLTWTPSAADAPGPHGVTFHATNQLAGTSTTSIAVDRHPVISVEPSVRLNERQPLTLVVTATDPDGDPFTALTADLSALPAGHDAVFAPNASGTGGTLTWTPTFADAPGPYVVAFTANAGLTATAGTSIDVVQTDAPPGITAPATASVPAGGTLTLEITATDQDGDAITALAADLTALPAGNTATFVPNAANTAGTLMWTPATGDGHGPFAITFTASNALTGSRVTSVLHDRAPVVNAPPALHVNENSSFAFGVTASDADGDAIAALSVSGVPPGASFTPNAANTSGSFQWTPAPGAGRPEPYDVTFTASNALAGSSLTQVFVNARPIAVLGVTPTAGGAPHVVTANASGSGDADGAVSNYTFDFGEGAAVGPQPAATATHTYASAGTYIVTVTVTDDHGASATATQSITVTASNLVGNPGFESGVSGWSSVGSAVLARMAGGRSGGFCLEMRAPSSSSFGATDGPNWIANVPAAGTPFTLSAWVRSSIHRGQVKLKIKEFVGSTQYGSTVYSNIVTLSPAWQLVSVNYTTVRAGSTLDFSVNGYPIASGEMFQMDDVSIVSTRGPAADRAPVVSVAATATVNEGATVTVTVTATDPDGQALSALTADLSSLPAGHNAVFTANSARTSGTLTWTPSANDGRANAYSVTFTATNALSGSAATAISVSDVPAGGGGGSGGTNLVVNPGFETDVAGWAKVGSTTLLRTAGGRSGNWCLEVRNSTSSTGGIADNPNIVPNVAAANTTYRISMWVRSAIHHGAAKVKVKEYLGGVQQGSSALSPGLPFSQAWQLVTFDYVTRAAGSSLEIEFNDYPIAAGEIFQIDDLSVVKVVNGAMPSAQARVESSSTAPEPAFGVWMANPVRGTGVMHFTLTRPGPAKIELFDLEGRIVGRPVDEPLMASGRHEVAIRAQYDSRKMPVGTYFYRLRTSEGMKSGRFVVLE